LFSRGREEVIRRFDYTEEERPIVAQVWGSDPELFYKAAGLIADLKFDGMDINLGCPEKNITSHGAGACLIEDRPRVKEIISAARDGLKNRIPLSIKTRLGYKNISTAWIPFLLEQQLDALIIHGRTAAELSKIPAHWDLIGEVAKLTHEHTVIIGNGDVSNYADAVEKCKTYGVDGVMIGRGIFHDLWAFDKNGISHMGDREELFRIMREHIRLFEKTGKNFAILKKFFKMYIQGFPNAGDLRERLMQTNVPKEAIGLLRGYLAI
jgi:tRNA-dihydrouridine synthase